MDPAGWGLQVAMDLHSLFQVVLDFWHGRDQKDPRERSICSIVWLDVGLVTNDAIEDFLLGWSTTSTIIGSMYGTGILIHARMVFLPTHLADFLMVFM